MARAFAWHARGRRFEPDILHTYRFGLIERREGFREGRRFELISSTIFMYFLYILYSASLDQYYIGHTQNIDDRLFRHNNSGSKSTKKANDWTVVYTETFDLRSEACSRELEIKKKKSRKYLQHLISSVG